MKPPEGLSSDRIDLWNSLPETKQQDILDFMKGYQGFHGTADIDINKTFDQAVSFLNLKTPSKSTRGKTKALRRKTTKKVTLKSSKKDSSNKPSTQESPKKPSSGSAASKAADILIQQADSSPEDPNHIPGWNEPPKESTPPETPKESTPSKTPDGPPPDIDPETGEKIPTDPVTGELLEEPTQQDQESTKKNKSKGILRRTGKKPDSPTQKGGREGTPKPAGPASADLSGEAPRTRRRGFSTGAKILAGSMGALFLSNLLRNAIAPATQDAESITEDLQAQRLLEYLAQRRSGRTAQNYRDLAALFQSVSPLTAQRFLNQPTLARGEVLIGQAIGIHDQINASPLLNPGAFQTFGPSTPQNIALQNQMTQMNALNALDNPLTFGQVR